MLSLYLNVLSGKCNLIQIRKYLRKTAYPMSVEQGKGFPLWIF